MITFQRISIPNPNIHNKAHISFNPRNGDWLANELNETTSTTDCSAFCSDSAIIGEDMLCSSGNYSINTGFYVNWSIAEGNDIVSLSSVSNNSVSISQNSSYNSGYVTLKGSVNSECGSITLSKRFFIGTPNMNMYKVYNASLNGNYLNLNNQIWNYLDIYYAHTNNPYNHPSPFSLKWQVTATNSWIRGNPSRLPRATINPNQNQGSLQIGIRAENKCGYSPWKWQTFNVLGVNGGGSGGILHPE